MYHRVYGSGTAGEKQKSWRLRSGTVYITALLYSDLYDLSYVDGYSVDDFSDFHNAASGAYRRKKSLRMDGEQGKITLRKSSVWGPTASNG